jgi:hypothetical protein
VATAFEGPAEHETVHGIVIDHEDRALGSHRRSSRTICSSSDVTLFDSASIRDR